MANHNTLSPDERAAMERLLAQLEQLRELRPGMTLNQATALLRVGTHPGKTVQELAGEANVATSVMSRALLDLGPMTRARDPGMGLVKHVQSTADLRVHEMSLTARGVALLRRLARLSR